MAAFHRVPVHRPDGGIDLLAPEDVFYVRAADDDSIIRTRSRREYRSTRPISDLEKLLPAPPFFRCHESWIVNLARIRSIERNGRDYDLRMDPPVNTRIPIARRRLPRFRRLTGVP